VRRADASKADSSESFVAPNNGKQRPAPCRGNSSAVVRGLSSLSSFTGRGLSVGGSFGGSVTAIGGGVTTGYFGDPNGNVFRFTSYSLATAAGVSGSGGFTFGVSNFQAGGFSGLSGEGTLSAGFGPSASMTISHNSSGSGVSYTFGAGAGLSVNGVGSYTTLTPVCSKAGSVLDF